MHAVESPTTVSSVPTYSAKSWVNKIHALTQLTLTTKNTTCWQKEKIKIFQF
jgi:hypothetical protein